MGAPGEGMDAPLPGTSPGHLFTCLFPCVSCDKAGTTSRALPWVLWVILVNHQPEMGGWGPPKLWSEEVGVTWGPILQWMRGQSVVWFPGQPESILSYPGTHPESAHSVHSGTAERGSLQITRNAPLPGTQVIPRVLEVLVSGSWNKGQILNKTCSRNDKGFKSLVPGTEDRLDIS